MRHVWFFRALGIASVAVANFMGAEAHAAEKVDPKHIEVLFSAEDELCTPLARVYDRLYHEHGSGTHIVLDWERQFSGRFRSIGLEEPRRINNLPAPNLDYFSPGGLRTYYRIDVSRNDRNRLVYLDDVCVGSCEEYSTVIWILKSGEGAKLKEYSWPNAVGTLNNWELFDPNNVDSQITFYLGPSKPDPLYPYPTLYPEIYARFLDKIATQQDKSLTQHERFMRFEPAIVGGSSPFIQQVWRFKQEAVFTARASPALVLVYRYIGNNAIDDVCYLAPEEAIALHREHSKT